MRLRLFTQLSKENAAPEGTDATEHEVFLLEKAQKILDRVLFICFCEDTGLLPHGVIGKAFEQAGQGLIQHSRWEMLVALFNAIDKGNPPLGINGYNGGLFASDPDLDRLTVSDDVLDDSLKLSGYDFDTDLNVNILGHIFEQSISDLENLRAEIRGESVDKTKTKRKKEGVFYTPEYITRFIVENTIGTWLQERFDELNEKHDVDSIPDSHHVKKQEAALKLWNEYRQVLENIKVLDPACGSGAFLVAAFDYLHAEYEKVNKELAALGQGGLFDLNKQILQENLFGVDINPESVEITKLALWLKTANKDKPLNNLDGNIKCGNSLIDSDSDAQSEMSKLAYATLPDDVQAKAFEWRKQFPQVFAEGGFNCVIGNPPYIRQEWLSPIKAYLETEYASYSGTADILIYFFEKGIRLLNTEGKLGYITSGAFTRSSFAKPFRNWIPTVVSYDKHIDFGDIQPFEDAEVTRPTISILSKSISKTTFKSLLLGHELPSSLNSSLEESGINCDRSIFKQEEWVFQSPRLISMFSKLLNNSSRLGEHISTGILYGIKTGLNKAFIVNGQHKRALCESEPTNIALLRPLAAGQDLRPWYQMQNDQWVILIPCGYTSTHSTCKEEAAAWAWFRSTHSAIAEHLSAFEKDARARSDQGEFWWELRPCDYYELFDSPKIFYPDIAKTPRFSYVEEPMVINNTAYMLPCESPYLLAILQSRFTWFAISQFCSPLHLRAGLWRYRAFTQFFERLPIPDVSDSDKEILANLAMQATEIANERYALHEQVRARILTDLGAGAEKLNNKLTAWYNLPPTSFRAEVKKAFKHDIPLKERTEWEQALAEWQEEHNRHTAKLIDVETEINDRVYKLYGLSNADIQLLEDHMKKTMIYYPLGEV